MIKSALLATAICFAFVVPASAQSEVKCDEASLTKMRADIDAMTDKDKQTTSIASWEKAQAAMKANKLDECNALMVETGKSVSDNKGDGGAATTTQ